MSTQQKNRKVSARARKSLGQHFLTSKTAVDSIVQTARLTDIDTVLEIGPGKGILTKALLQKAGKVIAVEKDKQLIEILKENFKEEITDKKLTLVSADILSLEFEKHIPKKFTVVANIPYYITGQLLRKLLSGKRQPKNIVLMLQKEVVDRIVARGGKESLLSLSVKVYGTPRYIIKVPKRYFKPQPKVDSAILSIENVSRDFFKTTQEKNFFELLSQGFAHKRKKLIRNVESLFSGDAEKIFERCAISTKARAENLTLEQWRCLSKKL